MQVENPQDTIFYSIEKAIKTYRQFAQRRIHHAGLEITLDQALLLRALSDYPENSQSEIADLIFKDHASVTRMIDLLVKKELLERSRHANDRRRYKLRLSNQGKKVLRRLNRVVSENRALAQSGISEKNSKQLRKTLHQIIENCEIK